MSCSLRDSPHRRRLLQDVRERLFTPAGNGAAAASRTGAEVEWIPWDRRVDRAMPIFDDHRGRGSLSLLREIGAGLGWAVTPGPHGAPSLALPGGATLSFEPGGQIELASPPLPSAGELARYLEELTAPLLEGARSRDVDFLSCGIDPTTPLAEARLVLPGERYAAMHRYLSGIGDAGPRMMLQTAAIQLNVELGPHPALRWRVLNAAAPHLTAIFANSRVYEERDTGYASYRAFQWRLLDRRRTGLLGRSDDAAEEYLEFALEAGWIFAPAARTAEPFVEWLLRGEVTMDDWRRHLTTLFPEIRPRGFLEIRCIDTLPPRWYPAPLALIAGILADETALREAAEIVGPPDSRLLQDAARDGIADPALGPAAAELFRAALGHAERTGVCDGSPLDTARLFYDSFTARGRSPGDEAVEAAA